MPKYKSFTKVFYQVLAATLMTVFATNSHAYLINAGGAYVIAEGDELVLSGSYELPDNNPFTLAAKTWDLNDDGAFGVPLQCFNQVECTLSWDDVTANMLTGFVNTITLRVLYSYTDGLGTHEEAYFSEASVEIWSQDRDNQNTWTLKVLDPTLGWTVRTGDPNGDWTVRAVPLPPTITLFVIGLVGLGVVSHRKYQASKNF